MAEEQVPRSTPTRPIRVPLVMWEAYGRVCRRLGTSRTKDLLDHMRERLTEHGDETDLADLATGEKELATRRSRKGGRPPKGTG
ncbi:hypothetical protein [Spirillospora sp. NBC_01491]|uniref:hypothetical protein n=1 Tax=Spirillospora sp. NBC_01491 TaxID=2976007 RepID=UPI002E3151FF|nr:hypothetical protein [Spirillospora sp. NBC_01491]